MNTRKMLVAAALCTSVALAACDVYEGTDEVTESTGQEATFKKLKGAQLTAACTAAKPKFDDAKNLCTASEKTDKAKKGQFLPAACCKESTVCSGAKFDGQGVCRKNGKFAPQSCCAAACGDARLDTNGLCRKANGQFAFGSCCQDQCLVFNEPTQAEVLCSENTCGGAADANETCFCDDQCAEFGDCCPNAQAVCELTGRGTTKGTCEKRDCGGPAENRETNPDTCFCDDQCANFDDCCDNKFETCGGRTRREPRRPGELKGTCEKTDCGGVADARDPASCFCDASCLEFGDCCPNAEEACPEVGATDPRAPGARGDLKGTCEKADCGLAADRANRSSCFCDAQCVEFGDCCANVEAVCGKPREPRRGAPTLVGSCAGKCDEQSQPGGCFCDVACTDLGDCCADKVDQCGGNGTIQDRPAVLPGLCSKNSCNKAGTGGQCFCDDACAEFGDCCANKASKCGGPGLDQEVIDCGPGECAGAALDDKQVCRDKNKQFAKVTCCATPEECTGAVDKGGVCTSGSGKAVPLACCAKTCGESPRFVRSRSKDECKNAAGDKVNDACCADESFVRALGVPRGKTAAGLKKRAEEAARRRKLRDARGNFGRRR